MTILWFYSESYACDLSIMRWKLCILTKGKTKGVKLKRRTMHYKQSCYVLVQIFSCYAFFSYSLVVGMIVWKVNPWTQHVLQVHHFMIFHLRTFSQQNEEKISSWIMSDMVQSLISLAECHVHNDLILWSQHAEDPSSFSRKRLVSATWFWLLERHSGL